MNKTKWNSQRGYYSTFLFEEIYKIHVFSIFPDVSFQVHQNDHTLLAINVITMAFLVTLENYHIKTAQTCLEWLYTIWREYLKAFQRYSVPKFEKNTFGEYRIWSFTSLIMHYSEEDAYKIIFRGNGSRNSSLLRRNGIVHTFFYWKRRKSEFWSEFSPKIRKFSGGSPLKCPFWSTREQEK